MAADGSNLIDQRPEKAAPVPYSEEIAAAICEAVASTARGLAFICATREGFPDRSAVHEWLHAYPEFRAQYDVAKLQQADLLFDECLEIADDGSQDTKTIVRNDGREVQVMDMEWVARSKLRVETRLKMAGKLHPKKYGDKLDVDATIGFIRHEDALAQLR